MKIGDVVHGRGSGTLMTVESVEGDAIGCVWFDKAHALHRAEYEREKLMPSRRHQLAEILRGPSWWRKLVAIGR